MLGALTKIASKTADVTKNILLGLLGGKKVPPKKGDSSDSSNSPDLTQETQILGSIFALMVQARQEELSKRADDERSHNDQIKKDNDRNDEIIKALTLKRKPKKKVPVKKKEPTKKKEEPPKKGAEPKKEEPPKKVAEKVQEKPIPPAKPKAEELPKQPEIKPSTEKVPPKAPPKEAPKPPAEKVTPRVPAGKISPYLLEATQNKTFMAGLGVLATKYNTTEKDLLSFMMNESNLNPAAHNKNGNASGLIQIMPNTLADMKKRNYKSVQNLSDVSDIRKLSLTEQLPLIDDYFDAQGLKKSASLAEKEGRKVDLGTLYTTVFLPIYKDKPNNYIMGIKPGVTAPNGETADTVIVRGLTKGMVYEANAAFDLKGKEKGYFTKGDVQEKASGFSSQVDTALKTSNMNQQVQEINNSSDKIDNSSKENKDLKTAAQAKSQTNVNNNITQQTQSNKGQSSQDESYDERNAHQKKK